MVDTATLEREGQVGASAGVAAPAPGGAQAGGEDSGEGDSKRAARYINFPKDAEIWDKLEQEADGAGKTPRQLVFELLSERYGVAAPVAGVRAPRKVYASEAEKAEAQKAKRKDRQTLINFLLQQNKDQLADLLAQAKQSAASA